MNQVIRFKRGTLAGLDALAAAGELQTGEPYYLLDINRLAMGTSPNTYVLLSNITDLRAAFWAAEFMTSGIFRPTDYGLEIGDAIRVLAVSGGGGGGGGGGWYQSAPNYYQGGSGGGGGGGYVVDWVVLLQSLNPITVTVGIGGEGGLTNTTNVSSGMPGNPGGSTKFGGYLEVLGGGGGSGGGRANPGGTTSRGMGGFSGARLNPMIELSGNYSVRGAGAGSSAGDGINGYCFGGEQYTTSSQGLSPPPVAPGNGGTGGQGSYGPSAPGVNGSKGENGFVRVTPVR